MAHRTVAADVFQCIRFDVCRTNHLHKFSCGDHGIDIMTCVLLIVKFHLSFTLLSHTWHYRKSKDLIRRYAQFLSVECLHNRTEHLLRRLRSGQIFHQMRILGFDETDPTRTAGCEHRTVF